MWKTLNAGLIFLISKTLNQRLNLKWYIITVRHLLAEFADKILFNFQANNLYKGWFGTTVIEGDKLEFSEILLIYCS